MTEKAQVDASQEEAITQESPSSLHELLARLDAEGITDFRRYDEVRGFLGFKAREKLVPLSGSFELTPLCNLGCKMCYVHLNRDQMQGADLLPTEVWKDIMTQAVEAGMMYASLTGGECLTYPGFKDLYLYLASMGVETRVLSNAVALDESMASFFASRPPASVQVTLYGASEEGYERVTGRRVFSRVMENVRRLRDLGIPLVIAVTPNAFMTDGPQVVRLLHEEGFPFVINSGLMRPREETGRRTADAGLDAYVEMAKLQLSLTGETIEPECDVDELPDPSSASAPAARGVRCGAGRSSFAVDWRGRMRPCNTFPCEPVDVLALGFAESWRRTNQTVLEYPLPAECEGCFYQNVCKHCVSEHAAGAEPGHASPEICRWVKRMVAEGLKKA